MDKDKSVVLQELTALLDEARGLPMAELCQRGDYKNQPHLRYPQTKGEFIADRISTLLLTQSWINGETEPILDDMASISGSLDRDVGDPEVWRKLFEVADELFDVTR